MFIYEMGLSGAGVYEYAGVLNLVISIQVLGKSEVGGVDSEGRENDESMMEGLGKLKGLISGLDKGV